MQQLRSIDATVTRNGDLYVLTCQDGDDTATFETSRALMLKAAAHLRVVAALRSAGGGDVRIRFPDKKMLTLPPEHASALARYIPIEIGLLGRKTIFQQLMNPSRN